MRVPIHFEQNDGQIDSRVRFLARANGYRFFLTARGAVIKLTGATRRDELRFGGRRPNREFLRDSRRARARARESAVVSITFDGARANPAVEGVDPIAARVSYFIGNDPKKWRTSVPIFARVRYRDVWPGIDLLYYGNEDSLEYDLIVAPGANPDAIRLRVDGAATRVDSAGDVVLETAAGNLRLLRPRLYQDGADRARRTVEGRFVVTPPSNSAANRTQTLSVKVADYDRSRALVIDPQLVYSTYLGGSGGRANSGAVGDEATELALDSSNNVYVTGFAYSTDFPITVGPADVGASNESSVAFVAKLNPSASGAASLVYATYLGGSGFRDSSNPPTIDGDEGLGIAVDASGDAYITGFTFSDDFPTTQGAFQTKNPHSAPGIGTAFVTEFDPSGANLLYSTFLGGSNGDYGSRLALTRGCTPPQCEAYVAGATMSADFPTHNPFQAVFPEPQDRTAAFVTVLAGDGGALVYSTFLGGTNGPDLGGDGALGIAADSSGNTYVTGFSGSSDFPTVGAFQKSNKAFGGGGQNAFVAKLDPFAAGGASLVYSSYLGGRGSLTTTGDFGVSIDVDAMGRAFLTGVAGSADFPIKRAFEGVNLAAEHGGQTAFVSELATDGSKLLYSTFLGGSSFIGDAGADLVVDSKDRVFVTGASASRDFPTTANACQTKSRGSFKNLSLSAFIAELNPEARSLTEQLVFSTYFGGRSMDAGTGIATDPSGLIYVDGTASSPDLPITSATAFQTSQRAFANGQPNAFIAVIDPSSGCPRIIVTPRSINFGRVGIGAAPAAHDVAIRNVGKDPLEVSVSGLSAPFSVADAGIFSVGPHSKKKLKVFFEPIPALATTFSGQLIISSDDPQHPSASINLKGRGEPGSLSLPKSLRFGRVRTGRSRSLTLHIRNTGLGLLTGSVNTSGVTAPFTASGQLSFSLASGQSQPLSVAFEPKTAGGPIFQTIEVSSDDPDHPLAIVLLIGVGT